MLIQSRMSIICEHPFLGYLLQSIPLEESLDIPTAATDGYKIMVNRSFMENLSEKEFIFILLHELLHIILSHPARGYHKDSNRFNIACDIVVNDILRYNGFGHDKLTPIYGLQFHMNGYSNTAEIVYDKLPQETTKQVLDVHTLWRRLTKSEDDRLKEILSKGIQSYPGSAIIKSIQGEGSKTSSYNWRKILQKFITKNIHDYSYQRCDKRFNDVLLPDYAADEVLKNIWIVLDVSGSMYHILDDVISQVFQVVKQHRGLEVDLSFFSTIVTQPLKVKSIADCQDAIRRMKTTGGTRFDIIFDAVPTYFKRLKPYAIIIMTDGYADFPKINLSRGIPTLWVITNDKVTPPFGEITRI